MSTTSRLPGRGLDLGGQPVTAKLPAHTQEALVDVVPPKLRVVEHVPLSLSELWPLAMSRSVTGFAEISPSVEMTPEIIQPA